MPMCAVLPAPKVLKPALAADPRFDSNARRTAARDELKRLIVAAFASLTAEEVVKRLDDAQIANARVNTMLDVWEHPQLEALADDGIKILGVNYKDDPDKALSFLSELGNPFVMGGADPAAKMATDWGVYGVPETFVVDGAGKVLFRFAGPLTVEVVEQQIAPLLAGEGE